MGKPAFSLNKPVKNSVLFTPTDGAMSGNNVVNISVDK